MARGNEEDSKSSIQKDCWDKSKIAAEIIAVILVPIVIFLCGSWINSTLKDKEINVKYVEIAAGILRDPHTGTNTKPIRDWAIDVLYKCCPSELKLSSEAKDYLKSHPLPFVSRVESMRGGGVVGGESKVETHRAGEGGDQ